MGPCFLGCMGDVMTNLPNEGPVCPNLHPYDSHMSATLHPQLLYSTHKGNHQLINHLLRRKASYHDLLQKEQCY